MVRVSADILVVRPVAVIYHLSITTHHFRFAVARPVGSLTLSNSSVPTGIFCREVHLWLGKSLAATKALAYFCDLLPCSPVQLLQTGTREPLSYAFHVVTTNAIDQLACCISWKPSSMPRLCRSMFLVVAQLEGEPCSKSPLVFS